MLEVIRLIEAQKQMNIETSKYARRYGRQFKADAVALVDGRQLQPNQSEMIFEDLNKIRKRLSTMAEHPDAQSIHQANIIRAVL